jgi:hypothetical protein
MPKDPTSTPPAEPSLLDPAALEAQLRAKIEAELRAEYEQKLRAAASPVPTPPAEGKPAIYYFQHGRDLVAVPVTAAGNNLHHPQTGTLLVAGAQSSDQPANGRFVLKS